jgi:hypothetical protein
VLPIHRLSWKRPNIPSRGFVFNADFGCGRNILKTPFLNNDLPNHEFNYQRYRPVWTCVQSFHDLDIGARIITERRSYLKAGCFEGIQA